MPANILKDWLRLWKKKKPWTAKKKEGLGISQLQGVDMNSQLLVSLWNTEYNCAIHCFTWFYVKFNQVNKLQVQGWIDLDKTYHEGNEKK